MASTFDPNLANDISQVRIEIGDTGDGAGQFPAGAEVADETIQYFLGLPLTPLLAAARIAWTLAAKYASMVDVTVDHQMTRASQRYAQYVALAKRLEERAAAGGTGAVPDPSPYDAPIVTGLDDCRGPIDYAYPYDGWRFL